MIFFNFSGSSSPQTSLSPFNHYVYPDNLILFPKTDMLLFKFPVLILRPIGIPGLNFRSFHKADLDLFLGYQKSTSAFGKLSMVCLL